MTHMMAACEPGGLTLLGRNGGGMTREELAAVGIMPWSRSPTWKVLRYMLQSREQVT